MSVRTPSDPATRAKGVRSRTSPCRSSAPLVAVVSVVLLSSAFPHSRTLPDCGDRSVRERLTVAIERIPALRGRDARLLDLVDPRARGFAGRRPLRACQGRLVTSAGTGSIEYSIHRHRDGSLVVRPELFQGGWRRELRVL